MVEVWDVGGTSEGRIRGRRGETEDSEGRTEVQLDDVGFSKMRKVFSEMRKTGTKFSLLRNSRELKQPKFSFLRKPWFQPWRPVIGIRDPNTTVQALELDPCI